ncbi:hypothetical protein HYV10_03630 [Candidatus Dependentiae bacterium]|nr:hypothetical protein [Candidatus Dependentiae bacterium]
MFRYKFLLILNIFFQFEIFCKSALDINHDQLWDDFEKNKRLSKTLKEYLEVLLFCRQKSDFDPYRSEFDLLYKQAEELLINHKKLSYLTRMYHQSDNCHDTLKEIHNILGQKMSPLEDVIQRLEAILFNVSQDNFALHGQNHSGCKAFEKLEELSIKRFRCLEQKDYKCLNELFEEYHDQMQKYQKCINFILKQKVLKKDRSINFID